MAGEARGALADTLATLSDSNVPAEALIAADYEAEPPLHGHDPLRAPGEDG